MDDLERFVWDVDEGDRGFDLVAVFLPCEGAVAFISPRFSPRIAEVKESVVVVDVLLAVEEDRVSGDHGCRLPEREDVFCFP